MKSLAPHYKQAKKADDAARRVMNHCSNCKAAIPGHLLHEDPDGPFNGRPPTGHFGQVVAAADVTVESARYS
jgi:hypothetical protein